MTEELKKYLRIEFNKNNLPKYQKYFNIWVDNLTINQINYYKQLWLKSNLI